MAEPKVTLEIRHQIGVRPDGGLFVRETFGAQPPIEWDVPDRDHADRLVAERRAMLMEMVADLGADAAEAVRDARHVDNLKGGNA